MATSVYGDPRPRQINSPQTSQTTQKAPDTGKHLALVGSFPFLDPSAVATVSNASALLRLNPASTVLRLLERLIYNCAPNEAKARQKPASIKLVNALSSTQAIGTLFDSQPQAALSMASRLWGGLGNRITVTVATGTAQGKKYTIAGPGLSTEVYDNVGGDNILTINYTGTEATTMTLAYDQSTGLRIAYTKTAIAVGTYTPSEMAFDGIISITPSGAAGVGVTFTATVTGTVAGVVGATSVLTWTNEAATAKDTSDFSAVTSILFAVTAGTPTFSIAGYAFDLTPGDAYPTAKSFSDRINLFTTQLFTSTIGSVTAAGLDSALLDSFTAATIKSAAKSLTADVNAAVDRLSGSALVAFTRASGADGAPANGTTMLAGGADGSETSQGYTDALELLQVEAVTHLWMDTDSATYQALALAHVVEMEGRGGLARQLWVGATANETLAQLRARRLAFNSKQTCLWFEEFQRSSPTGVATWYAPKYLALTEAALRCALPPGEPSTYKRPNVLDFRCASTINPDQDGATLIQEGLCYVRTVAGLGIINERPVTTYGVGDSVFYDEPGSVESFYMSTNDVHAAVQAARALGSSNVRFTDQDYLALVIRRLNLQLSGTSRLIKNWDPTSAVVTTVNGDWYRATYDVQPIQGVNFIETLPTATFVSASVTG